MRLTEQERRLIEHGLDTLMQRIYAGTPPPIAEIRLYERAVAIVRDRPAGIRRIRADHQTIRPTPQSEMGIP